MSTAEQERKIKWKGHNLHIKAMLKLHELQMRLETWLLDPSIQTEQNRGAILGLLENVTSECNKAMEAPFWGEK